MFARTRFNPLKIRELTRRTIRSFPSAYQILPHQDFYLRDDQGRSSIRTLRRIGWRTTPSGRSWPMPSGSTRSWAIR